MNVNLTLPDYLLGCEIKDGGRNLLWKDLKREDKEKVVSALEYYVHLLRYDMECEF